MRRRRSAVAARSIDVRVLATGRQARAALSHAGVEALITFDGVRFGGLLRSRLTIIGVTPCLCGRRSAGRGGKQLFHRACL
jgi:hypothetical protein